MMVYNGVTTSCKHVYELPVAVAFVSVIGTVERRIRGILTELLIVACHGENCKRKHPLR